MVNAPFDPVMFEIADVACNKGRERGVAGGLLRYCRRTRSRSMETGGNDIAMLCVSATAMTKNASDTAKAAASATIGSRGPTPFPSICSPPCASKTPAPSSNNVAKG